MYFVDRSRALSAQIFLITKGLRVRSCETVFLLADENKCHEKIRQNSALLPFTIFERAFCRSLNNIGVVPAFFYDDKHKPVGPSTFQTL
jgi:hypothetical protein